MQDRVGNQLADIRKSRGVAAAELARRVGISRQTIHAIEAGTYVPNTEITLRLARELEVAVEQLFSLVSEQAGSSEPLSSELLSASVAIKGQPVRICQIGSRWVSIPVTASPCYLPEADAVISKIGGTAGRADLAVFTSEDNYRKRLVIAGCDPAMGLLAPMVEKISGVEVVLAAASSALALAWLKAGKVHVAGSHLEDAETGEFNLPYIRRALSNEDFTVITFARWEEGLVTDRGNPKEIRGVADLGRNSVRFMNRERGSGSRALLDRLLREAGLARTRIRGYERTAYGHLAAAYSVLSGEADCCLATRSAARTFGLDFLPLRTERYDLVMRKGTLELPAAQAFADVLQRASLRRKLEALAGYDTAQTGAVLA
jgi:molybdate-binding protein/DNA-binding XRE family transcriptional regulator